MAILPGLAWPVIPTPFSQHKVLSAEETQVCICPIFWFLNYDQISFINSTQRFYQIFQFIIVI